MSGLDLICVGRDLRLVDGLGTFESGRRLKVGSFLPVEGNDELTIICKYFCGPMLFTLRRC